MRSTARFLNRIVATLSLMPGIVAACTSGTYQEPGNGATWNFTFGGTSVTATRTDGGCSISSGKLSCINGFLTPVTLTPSLTCGVITSNLPWLSFKKVVSGTLSKRLTDDEKIHYGVISFGLAAGSIAAIAVADECLAVLNVFCADYFFAEAMALAETAGSFAKLVRDPSDPNFTVLAIPAVTLFIPILPNGSLNQASADKLNALLNDLAATSAYSFALLTALNRTQGAIDAGDTFWQTQQLIYATMLARQEASFVNAQPYLLNNVVSALKAWGISPNNITVNNIAALQSQIAAQGLPLQVLALLQQRGADADMIAAIEQLISKADPTLAAGSYPDDWTKFGQWTAPTATALLSFASAAPSVPISADLNDDGKVDCSDVSIVKATFNKTAGQVGFDVRADMNSDGVINIRDVAFVSQHLPAGLVCQ